MKRILICIGFLFCVFMAPFCAEGAEAISGASFNEVMGKDWILEEFKSGSVIISIDRTKSNDTNIYSLRFDAQRLNGIGAPNRYSAPYTTEEGNILSIGMIASTRMGSIFENDNLKEHDFFGYLRKTYRWDLQNGKLKLYTYGEPGIDVVLTFN